MTPHQFDAMSRTLAAAFSRRHLVAALLGSVGLAVTRPPLPTRAGGRKAVGTKCQRHSQCASGLCEASTGTCVAQCAVAGDLCGVGGICQPVGAGGAGHACVVVPADLNCTGYTPCTWNDRARDPADQLSCPDQPGYICLVTGLCSGPEEVCVPLSPPS
jgi:hypothetical protein